MADEVKFALAKRIEVFPAFQRMQPYFQMIYDLKGATRIKISDLIYFASSIGLIYLFSLYIGYVASL